MVLSSEHTFALAIQGHSMYLISCLLSLPNIQLLGAKHSWRDFRHPHITSTAKSIGQESIFIFHRTSRSWARMARLRRAVERKNPSRISICIYFAPRLRCCQKLDEVKNLVLTMGLFKENTENQCKQLSVARFIIFLHWHGKTLEFHNNASIKCPWECLLKSCWSNVFISQDFD